MIRPTFALQGLGGANLAYVSANLSLLAQLAQRIQDLSVHLVALLLFRRVLLLTLPLIFLGVAKRRIFVDQLKQIFGL